MPKRKSHSLAPRHKRLKRGGRLNAAKHWLSNYNGKSIIKGYSKHFGVNAICAVIELQMLGQTFEPELIKQLKKAEENRAKERARRRDLKRQQEVQNMCPDSDDNFYFIAGYTSGGAPFGVTWGDMEMEPFDWPDDEPF